MATTVTASTSSGITTATSAAFPSVPIYKPKFDWTTSNLYEQFKLFNQKCTYLLINGPYSHVPAHLQVSVFLNWFGNSSYELINTIEFSPRKSKDVLNDIEQFESYFKPSQSTFQLWYELGSLYSSQFKNQNDFLNKLFDGSKDCELDNPNELVKFLFLVHNQNSHVCENLFKELKSDSTLQDCLCIAKLTEGTVHVEKLGENFLANVGKHDQNLMLLIVEDSNSRSEMDQNSDRRARARAKEAPKAIKEEKVVRNHVVTVEPTSHLVSVQHMEKTALSARKKDISVPTANPAGPTNSMVIHPQEDLDINMKWNKMTMVIIGHFP